MAINGLTLPQRKFVIEFIIKHDSSKDRRIQLNKTFSKTFFLEHKETVSDFLCCNVSSDILNSAMAVGLGSRFYCEYAFDVWG